jgi:hypothetical protein
MNTLKLIRLSSAVLMAGVAMFLSGCSSCKPGVPGPVGKYDIQVTLDQSLKDSSMRVDLVGVNPASLPSWQAYSMTKYWQTGDAKRADAQDKFTFDFVSGKSLTNVFSSTNALWKKWAARGVTHVVVLANLPGAARTDNPGNQDPRRQILPLDKCYWANGTKALNLLVQQSGIEVLTPTRNTQ